MYEDARLDLETIIPSELEAGWEWHFWMGDASDGALVREHILCWSHSGIEPEWDETGLAHVTIEAQSVNCQSCLEWLHA